MNLNIRFMHDQYTARADNQNNKLTLLISTDEDNLHYNYNFKLNHKFLLAGKIQLAHHQISASATTKGKQFDLFDDNLSKKIKDMQNMLISFYSSTAYIQSNMFQRTKQAIKNMMLADKMHKRAKDYEAKYTYHTKKAKQFKQRAKYFQKQFKEKYSKDFTKE